jgi:hypothetical protein
MQADLESGKFGWFQQTPDPLFSKSPRIGLPKRRNSSKKKKAPVRSDSIRRADQPTEGKKSYPKSVIGGQKAMPESPPPRQGRPVDYRPSDRSTSTSSSFDDGVSNWYLRQDPMFGHQDKSLHDSHFRARGGIPNDTDREVGQLRQDNSQLVPIGGPLDNYYRSQPMGYDIPPEAFYGYPMGYPLMSFPGPWFYNQWMPPYTPGWPGVQDPEDQGPFSPEMWAAAAGNFRGRSPFLREAVPHPRPEDEMPSHPHPRYLPEPASYTAYPGQQGPQRRDQMPRRPNEIPTSDGQQNESQENTLRRQGSKKSPPKSTSISRSSSFDDVIDTEIIRQQEEQRIQERPRVPPVPPKPSMAPQFMPMSMGAAIGPTGYYPQNKLVNELRRVMNERGKPQEAQLQDPYPQPPWASPPRPSTYVPNIPTGPFAYGPLPTGANQAFHFRSPSDDSRNSYMMGDNPVTLIL